MRNDKISIIVPAYNIESYIEKTVESICAQTYRDLEIILVNDGSSDRTPELLNELANRDERIKVIHKENGGVTRARLCGVEAATGEWIGFVDGDDYIEPQMYEMLLSNAQKYEADISHCGYQMVFPSRVDLHYGTGRLVEQDTKTGLKDLLEGSYVEPGLWNKLFHRTLFKEMISKEKMDLSIKINEDLLMNFYLFKKSKKSVFCDECLYHYMLRVGSAATTKINENKLRDPLKVLNILDRETKEDLQLNLIVNKRIVAQLIRLATMQVSGKKELISPYCINARKELKNRLPVILRGDYSTKQKLMAIFTAGCPGVYRLMYGVYGRITGLDKKYEVK